MFGQYLHGARRWRAAIPGRESEALEDFEAAQVVADRLSAGAVHVTAGITDAPEALDVLRDNLARFASMTDRLLLIEPISAVAIPGYALRRIEDAAEVVARVDAANLRIMFDCFHIAAEGGNVEEVFQSYAPLIGHVQIASFPERGSPDGSLVPLIPLIEQSGLDVLGCEFHPPQRDWCAKDIRSVLGFDTQEAKG